MSQSMIEKLADAIEDSFRRTRWKGTREDVAKAALKALLEPTEGMVSSGGFSDGAEETFKAMIRAALDGK